MVGVFGGGGCGGEGFVECFVCFMDNCMRGWGDVFDYFGGGEGLGFGEMVWVCVGGEL